MDEPRRMFRGETAAVWAGAVATMHYDDTGAFNGSWTHAPDVVQRAAGWLVEEYSVTPSALIDAAVLVGESFARHFSNGGPTDPTLRVDLLAAEIIREARLRLTQATAATEAERLDTELHELISREAGS